MYVSTLALLSKCWTPLSLPPVILVTLGNVDQRRKVTPAATEASAIALPWAISIVAHAFSQTMGKLSVPNAIDGVGSFQVQDIQFVIAKTT